MLGSALKGGLSGERESGIGLAGEEEMKRSSLRRV